MSDETARLLVVTKRAMGEKAVLKEFDVKKQLEEELDQHRELEINLHRKLKEKQHKLGLAIQVAIECQKSVEEKIAKAQRPPFIINRIWPSCGFENTDFAKLKRGF